MEQEELNRQYHPAFCAAMTQIFEHDTVEYTYEQEYNLNTMPNRIDFLVIKNNNGMSDNGIGKLFRRYNIFEYKSPGQALGEAEYHLVMAYAHLYSVYDNVNYDDITVSLVREGRPCKLMEYFIRQGFAVTEFEKGIYHVEKNAHIDMQIVVLRELGDQYIWLKVLTDKVTREDAEKLAKEAAKEQEPQGKERIRSILDLVTLLNRDKDWMKEDVIGMGAFRDLFKEEFEEKDNKIEELSEQLKNQGEQLQSQSEQLKNQGEQLQSQSEQLKSQGERLQSQGEQLKSQGEQLQSQSEQLKSQGEQLQSQGEQLQKKDKEIESLKKQLREQMGKIAML